MECFSVFFCIFSVFLPWNRLPEFFCVSQSLFSIFFSGRIGGILLSPYVVAQLARVGPFIHGFSSFSVCLLHVLRSATGWRTCFCSFNVGSSFSEVLVTVFSSCFEPHDFAFKRDCSCSGPTFVAAFRVQRTSLPVFQRGSSPVSSIVFQGCFPRCFQLCLGCCQLAFFSCR